MNINIEKSMEIKLGIPSSSCDLYVLLKKEKKKIHELIKTYFDHRHSFRLYL